MIPVLLDLGSGPNLIFTVSFLTAVTSIKIWLIIRVIKNVIKNIYELLRAFLMEKILLKYFLSSKADSDKTKLNIADTEKGPA